VFHKKGRKGEFTWLVLLDKDPLHNEAARNNPNLAIKAPRPAGILSLLRRLAGGIAMATIKSDLAAYFDVDGYQRSAGFLLMVVTLLPKTFLLFSSMT